MLQINDPRLSILEQLQEKPRTEAELFRALPHSSMKLRRALGFLRERDLVELQPGVDPAQYASNFPLDQDVQTSFVNFLVALLEIVRTIRRRPDLHEELVQNLQVQLLESDSLARSFGDLFFRCLVGRVPSPFQILDTQDMDSKQQPRATFPVTLLVRNPGDSDDDRDGEGFEEYLTVATMN